MEYIKDGNFLEELSSNWFVTSEVERVADVGPVGPDDKYFAKFGGGGRLSQSFSFSGQKPSAIRFSAGVRVVEGDGASNGNLQLLVSTQAGNNPPEYQAYVINEFGTWQTAQIVLPVDPSVDQMAFLILVVQGFDDRVSIRKVSVTDAVGASASESGAKKSPEKVERPEGMPKDWPKS